MSAYWGVLARVLLITSLVLGRAPLARAQEDATCLMCHSSASMFQHLEEPERMVVNQDEFEGSVHGALGLSCVMCHQDLVGTGLPHATGLESPNCSACHGDISTIYLESVHGYGWSRGNPRAPTCATCHGRHNIRRHTAAESRTHRLNQSATCAECHGEAGLLTEEFVKLPRTAMSYAQSVHGAAASAGMDAATCTDCHGVHDLKGPADPASRINPLNMSATCGQCHAEIREEYDRSIHGRALRTGLIDSPACNDCHGEHLILSHLDHDARTWAANLATQTCGPCHDDPDIVVKYNLQGGVLGTYVDSYHGWSTRFGGEATATCVSCHTAHSVLPAADSASSIHPANVVATCGRCHEPADEAFAASYTHETTSISANPVNRIIRTIYLWLIALVIGGMVLHNLLIMNYFVVKKRREGKKNGTVLRLDRSQIIQHLLLTISFAMLVITGFALRFPEAWWVEALSTLGMTEEVRGDLHRIFAVVLIAASLYHMYYIVLTRRGRDEIRSMLPNYQDIVDAGDSIGYHLFLRDKKVRFGRYDYTQKAEYWALIWGTLIMVITGFVLWFPTEAVRVWPSWWLVPAAQTIHYYEAWLATLAIIVWHFFFVIFHPDAYPMSWTWITGKMTREEVRKHHARWYAELTGADDESASP
ncbi:MAG: cytochrome c3 family protein [Gemmatimonadota bacterium]|nr:MAG: cytochrome c3 family protein [Gemmatimonadota bacterium]